MPHEQQIEIRWRDLDSYGQVNQAVYLTYAEEILDDWFQTKLGRRRCFSLRRLSIRSSGCSTRKDP